MSEACDAVHKLPLSSKSAQKLPQSIHFDVRLIPSTYKKTARIDVMFVICLVISLAGFFVLQSPSIYFFPHFFQHGFKQANFAQRDFAFLYGCIMDYNGIIRYILLTGITTSDITCQIVVLC